MNSQGDLEKLYVEVARLSQALEEIASGRCTCGDDLVEFARETLDPEGKRWPPYTVNEREHR